MPTLKQLETALINADKAGDEEAARESLLLFVKDHPREPVPDDLEPLLEP